MSIDEIVTSIERRLLLAADEVAQLQDARDALTGTPPADPDPAPVPASPARRAPRRALKEPVRAPVKAKSSAAPRRAADAVALPALLGLLADSDGLSTRELADQSGGASAQILSLLKEQEAAGEVRRSGSRGTTRWHQVTDEDRIAARVAELTAQREAKT
jgi:hypothetical protein